MPTIQIISEKDQMHKNLVDKFDKEEFQIKNSDYNSAMQVYDTFIPDMVLIDFEDMHQGVEICNAITEYDNTACIFAFRDDIDEMTRIKIISTGVRGIFSVHDMDASTSALHIMQNLQSVCNVMNKQDCAACWLTKKITDLSILI